jgi:hypothetical protein
VDGVFLSGGDVEVDAGGVAEVEEEVGQQGRLDVRVGGVDRDGGVDLADAGDFALFAFFLLFLLGQVEFVLVGGLVQVGLAIRLLASSLRTSCQRSRALATPSPVFSR